MLRRARFVLILALPFFGVPAAAVDFGRPLTAEQVACEERQLERLQHRMDVWSLTGSIFLWRSASGGGVYRGLASTNELSDQNEGRTRKEEQLAFDLLFKQGEDYLDPRRPLLPQATLVRRDVDSNLHTAQSTPPYLAVTLDLAPEVSDPTNPRLPLQITSRLAPGEGDDDRAGRGIVLDDLVSPCHSEINEFDLRVFSILARTVRPSQCLVEPGPSCGAGLERYRLVLFRGAEPLTYRMNVYSYLVACDNGNRCGYGEAGTAFLFRLLVDERGRLTGGEVEALPWCSGPDQVGCTFNFSPSVALFVLPPLRPGIERQGEAEFLRASHLNIEYKGSPYNVLQDTVNWADLLQDTSWNGGLVP